MRPLTIDRIGFDILDRNDLSAIVRSANRLFGNLHNGPDGPASLRAQLWPLAGRRTQPQLVLSTLDRIGSVQGKSGARVLLGYCRDIRRPGVLYSSRPFVIKIRQLHKGVDRLRDEYKRANAVTPYIGDRGTFVLPFHFDSATRARRPAVLWAPLTASEMWTEAAFGEARHSDLWATLTDQKGTSAEVLGDAYVALRSLHSRMGSGASQRPRRIVREYARYLRGFGKTSKRWWRRWLRTWGESRSVRVFGRTWSNPVWVFNRLQDYTVRISTGAVHGDFHPKNIVVDASGRPRVIDFGWTELDRHIAVDFVLMECNLKFMTVEADLPFASAHRLARFKLGGRGRAVDGVSEDRLRALERLRDIAEATLGVRQGSEEWEWEYETPLFLVSLGLLKHIQDSGNQVASQVLPLVLASRLERLVS